jgi:hypothetical protein
MILVEMVHDARIVPIFANAEAARASYRPDVIQQWLGDSAWAGMRATRSWCETKQRPSAASAAMSRRTGMLTERFTRWNDKQIVYEFTVEDPSQYSRSRGKARSPSTLRPSRPTNTPATKAITRCTAFSPARAKQEREGKTVKANAAEEGRGN